MSRAVRPGRSLHRLLLRSGLIVVAGLLLSAASWSAFRHGVERPEPGLPVLGTVPEFSLLASNGQPLSQASLAGGIWVADFIFTSCASMCPILTAHMAQVQEALTRQSGNPVRLVSFSVDPATDTPEALRAYAERFRADPARWLFVTGDRDSLHTLIGQGFRLAVANRSESENTDGEGLITHSDRFVLVDRDLRIRGYYHGMEDESVAQLLRDVETLRTDS